jgi:hypothetical protein
VIGWTFAGLTFIGIAVGLALLWQHVVVQLLRVLA